MKVKLCGMRRPEDISYVNEFCPDYVGFVFAESKRRVNMEQARMLISALQPEIRSVGVFVNESQDRMLEIAEAVRLDVIQLHGDEDYRYIKELRSKTSLPVWKAVRVNTAFDIVKADALPVDALLLDSFTPGVYGGSGRTANWEIIKKAARRKPIFLAGGLREDNLQEAIRQVRPYGVDLSGGIETDGVKDREKIKAVKERIQAAVRRDRERQENA